MAASRYQKEYSELKALHKEIFARHGKVPFGVTHDYWQKFPSYHYPPDPLDEGFKALRQELMAAPTPLKIGLCEAIISQENLVMGDVYFLADLYRHLGANEDFWRPLLDRVVLFLSGLPRLDRLWKEEGLPGSLTNYFRQCIEEVDGLSGRDHLRAVQFLGRHYAPFAGLPPVQVYNSILTNQCGGRGYGRHHYTPSGIEVGLDIANICRQKLQLGVVNVFFHEIFHGEQASLADKMDRGQLTGSHFGYTQARLCAVNLNCRGYISPDDFDSSSNDYWDQPVEVGARYAGDQAVMTIIRNLRIGPLYAFRPAKSEYFNLPQPGDVLAPLPR